MSRPDGPEYPFAAKPRADDVEPRPAGPGPAAAAADAADTPLSWRIAAGAMLGGGVLAGLRLAAAGRGPAFLLGAGLTAAALPIAWASRHPPVPPGDVAPVAGGASPTFSVVVAARDEVAVLPALVRDVAAQTWSDPDGRPRFELLVVDDRSTDGTAEATQSAAEAAGIGRVTRVIRREGEDLADGKGAALTAVQPDLCRGDVIVVLDADARIGPGFLATLAGYVAAGVPALTARRRVFGASASHLAGMQADEQTLDGELQRGRWALGGCSEFRGNGIVIERSLLASLGGWRASALTEDLDLSSRLGAAHGLPVAWAIDAEVWEEPVGSWSGLWRQRVRWAEGALRRVFEHGPVVVRSDRLQPRAKADFLLYAGQLAAPPLIVGAMAGAVRGRSAAAATLVASYLAVAGGLTWDALRWEVAADGGPIPAAERFVRAVRAALFSAIWLGALPAALWRLATRRGRVRYDKMSHHGRPAGG